MLAGYRMKYRAEIDGLRAVAVLPVVLFHAGFQQFSGGFIGVDVFFVISGYLITSLIMSEKNIGAFSLLSFYARRARRILPALFFVMLCSAPLAWLWMLPDQLKAFADSVASVVVFSSNILFWREHGYFEAAVEYKPLLHTWSLAVEEQYYLLFPLFIIAAWRFGRGRILSFIVVGAVFSFALAEYASRNFPTANFYLLPTRAWELLIGAGTSIILMQRVPSNNISNNILAASGLFLILSSVFVFDGNMPYPSLLTLVPAVGTALIIAFASPHTYVNYLLSLRPFVGIGLISYSFYLWHQPLFAFARIRSLHTPSRETFIWLIVISLLLALFTWVIIERPFRSRTSIPARTATIAVSSTAIIFMGLSLSAHYFDGFPSRNPLMESVEQRIRVNFGLSEKCEYGSDFQVKPECELGTAPTLVIWGDSYAMHLVSGIKAANPTLSFVQATRSVCGPILGLSPTNSKHPLPWAEKCLAFNNSVFEYLTNTPAATDVILSSPFDQYTNGSHDFLTSEGLQKWNTTTAVNAFSRTIKKLEALGKRVWVVSPPAADGDQIGLCLSKAYIYGIDLKSCDVGLKKYLINKSRSIEFLKEIENKGARVVWLPEFMCNDGVCAASKDGIFLYRDAGHLSQEGSEWLGLNTTALVIPPTWASAGSLPPRN